MVIGIIILLAAGGAGAWYFLAGPGAGGGTEPADTAAVTPDDGGGADGDGAGQITGAETADPQFFAGNAAVNAAVLASLKPGGSGARSEVLRRKPLALRGTIVTPEKVIDDGLLVITYEERNGKPVGIIKSVGAYSAGAVPSGDATVVDLTGYNIYPGFIDMHNHVHYNVSDLWKPTYDIYPNRDVWPKDPRYSDWKKVRFYFGRDYKNLTVETTKWGEIRGLLCGSTMMQGYDGDAGGYNLLCRNVENKGNNFGVDRINQSVMSVSMWYKGGRAEGAREKLLESFSNGRARRYIMHFCEGIDDRIRDEFVQLKNLNLLREEMVGIHSTGVRGSDWDAIAAAGQKVVWSPLSNLILYNQTTDIKRALSSGVPIEHISFGPDWAPSGTPGMLYEAKVVAEYNEREMGGLLTPQQMVQMMTSSPAIISSYDEFVGTLEQGKIADITVVKQGEGDAYESLLKAKIEDVSLVMVGGQPLYGTLDIYRQLGKGNDYEIFTMNGVEKAIDITEDGVPKGDQTLRELLTFLNGCFDEIRQNMPFEFREDVPDYCHLAPMYWPQYTSYSTLMYLSVLGKGSDYTADNRGERSFRSSDMYRNRNEQAKEQYNALRDRIKAERAAARGGNEGGEE